jgi:pyridoxamine 5'-phosphate oxidase
MTENNLIEPRRDYSSDTLSRSQLASSPFQQFENWLADARTAKLIDATAMMLSTSDSDNQPHSRVVLLKEIDDSGFSWYTDQQSNKGQELEANPRASLLFYWRELERQVRIEGVVQKLSEDAADKYFNMRPEGSRFSAAASNQSQAVENREALAAAVKALHDKHPDGIVPRPSRWGGYKLTPNRFEFWQGRDDRLHDRFIYSPADNDQWQTQRLSP